MSKHTPGTWSLSYDRSDMCWKVYGLDGMIVCREIPEKDMARLIADAPDMRAKIDRLEAINAELLAALEECVSIIKFKNHEDMMSDDVHAAISKATENPPA